MNVGPAPAAWTLDELAAALDGAAEPVYVAEM